VHEWYPYKIESKKCGCKIDPPAISRWNKQNEF